MSIPLFYRIRKDTDEGVRWVTNIVFDNPNGTTCSLHHDELYGILLTPDTAEYALKKLNDSSYSKVEGW
jgi:hypothetical protein